MKKILFSILFAVVFLVLIVPLFLPDNFTVKRTAEIPASPIEVFTRVSNLQTWKDWSPWYQAEPTAFFSFEGTPGVVGSRSVWSGKVIGAGEQTLTKVVQSEYLEMELVFTEPQASKATGYWAFEKTPIGTTQVTWGIKGGLSYPVERYIGLFFDGMIGKDFELGLSSLKKLFQEKN